MYRKLEHVLGDERAYAIQSEYFLEWADSLDVGCTPEAIGNQISVATMRPGHMGFSLKLQDEELRIINDAVRFLRNLVDRYLEINRKEQELRDEMCRDW